MPFTVTNRMVEIMRLHRDTCIANGIPQAIVTNRKPEGTLASVPGFPNNTDYKAPDPRTAQMPLNTGQAVWMTWGPVRLKGGVDGAIGGDSRAMKGAMYRMRGQCPVIDDFGNQIIIKDDDVAADPLGSGLMRIENPSMTPDGAAWIFEIVRHR